MITAGQIAMAKALHTYRNPDDILHEHDDCIRICYEWLSAQKLQKSTQAGPEIASLRNLIIRWGGSYVSRDDLDIALHFLPSIKVDRYSSNLSKRLTLPSDQRLVGIGQAMRHRDKRDDMQRMDGKRYKLFE